MASLQNREEIGNPQETRGDSIQESTCRGHIYVVPAIFSLHTLFTRMQKYHK